MALMPRCYYSEEAYMEALHDELAIGGKRALDDLLDYAERLNLVGDALMDTRRSDVLDIYRGFIQNEVGTGWQAFVEFALEDYEDTVKRVLACDCRVVDAWIGHVLEYGFVAERLSATREEEPG